MSREKGPRTRARLDARRELEKAARCQRPEVREALATIKREARANFAQGVPNERQLPAGGAVRGFPEPFWLELSVCRRNGLDVHVVDELSGPRVEVTLAIRAEGEVEGLAARLAYPQNLLSDATHDLWEIRRDAPLGRVLHDVEAQWRELADGRTALGSPPSRVRGSSSKRELRAIDAYRLRVEGGSWSDIATRLRCHRKTAESRVRDLCVKANLPRPRRGVLPLGAPTSTDCDACPRRRGPATPCDTCPWVDWLNSARR